ncbi:winged helix-turn-helix domain-containing protein [Trichodesmium erythraeum]|uniref:winged helix-turn-helix domain-containing protein n=1 Tax=Trichodesmium erythraeum TaxID=1206 RepID=UPI00351B593A
MSNVIELRWGVKLKTTRIYEILNELNLSAQKAHRNYANTSQEQQKTFILSLKKIGI